MMTQNYIASAIFILASSYALFSLAAYLLKYLKNADGGCGDKCACSAKELVRKTSKAGISHKNTTYDPLSKEDLHSLKFEKNRNKL